MIYFVGSIHCHNILLDCTISLQYQYQYLKNNRELSHLGIYPSESFINSQMSIAMAHGVTMRLCENNYMELADKVLNEMFHIHLLTDDE